MTGAGDARSEAPPRLRPAGHDAGADHDAGAGLDRDTGLALDTGLDAAVVAARAGDEDAFRLLYRDVQPRLLRYLRGLVGDEAEDVAAEAWLQIARDLSGFDGSGDKFRGWAAMIGRNRALDHLRRMRRRPASAMPIEELVEPADPFDTAVTAVEALDTAAALRLVAMLPSDQAEAVMLRVVMGLDATSAAAVLGKRAGAVRTATYRGLRRLAALLDAQNGRS